jgi:hypothetical protein
MTESVAHGRRWVIPIESPHRIDQLIASEDGGSLVGALMPWTRRFA